MLVGKKIAILGGDDRQLAIMERLLTQRAKLVLFGFDELKYTADNVSYSDLSTCALTETEVLVLPVSSLDNEGNVFSKFSDKQLVLKGEHLGALPQNATVFTGVESNYLRRLCKSYHISLVELLERDDIAIKNAIPTVEGAIMLAIQHTPFTLHGSICWVVGLGRVGLFLAHRLLLLGAKVIVTTRNPVQRAQGIAMGFQVFNDYLSAAVRADVLFNTVPSIVITSDIIDALPKHTWILDLASSPGGLDHTYVAKRGLKSMLAPALPGKVAPQTAGFLLADAIVEILSGR